MASSQDDWSGSLPDGTVWASGVVQRIIGNVTVPAGATLTIQPGAIVKFAAGTSLIVQGTLTAHGTAAAPIIFTSYRDDSAGGDTDNNGPTTGANGDWNRIEFASGSTGNVLDHAEVRYGGGYDALAEIGVTNAPLAMTNSVVRNSFRAGVRLTGSNPTLTANTFQDNAGAAVSMDVASSPAISGVTLRNNGLNGLAVDGGTLPADNAWDDPDIVYQLSNTVTVPTGRRLAIAAGQIIKTASGNPLLVVAGTLAADGTAARPVIFTSYRDDSAGGDTNNNNLSSGSNGDWNRIEFASGSTGNVLDHVEVRYGGGYDALAEIGVTNAPLAMTNSVVRNSFRAGVRLTGSNPTLTANTFQDNAGAAVSMDVASSPAISGVTLKNNGLNGLAVDGGTLPADNAWDDPDIVYQLSNTVTVPAGRRLAIAAGQIIKTASGNPLLVVAGTLAANGTAAQPVIFTSYRDDSAGGDTNNNGVTAGNNGDWNRIEFASGSTGNVLDHVEVRYGGGYDALAEIGVTNAPLAMTNSVVRNSFRAGVRLTGSNPTLTANTFQDNAGAAVGMDVASSPAISGVTLKNNGLNGLAVDGGILSASNSWDDPDIVYQVTNTVKVAAGAKLTIAPGQIIKAATGNPLLVVEGTLDARGNAAQPIIVTSYRDDSAGGDTNNNGVTAGVNGDWNRIEFASNSTANVLDHVEVRYGGGYDAQAAVLVTSAPLILTNSAVRNSFRAGVRIVGANPTLTNNIFKDNAGAAVSMDLPSNPAITGVTTANNGLNGLALDGGALSADNSWDDPDIVYQVTNTVTVPAGRQLTITAGQIIKAATGNPLLVVAGTLAANGTAARPVIFTSYRDDSAGGDTNNNGVTAGVNGDWNRIEFASTSAANVLDHVEVRYGGGYDAPAPVFVNGGSLELSQSSVRASYRSGLRIQQSSPTGEGNDFEDNAGAAISSDLKSTPNFAASTFKNNGVDGLVLDSGALPGDLMLESRGLTHWLAGDVSVPQGVTLTIGPGAVMGAQDSRNFTGAGLIGNAGRFVRSTDFGTTAIGPDFVNTGTVAVSAGTLSFNGSLRVDGEGTLAGRPEGTIGIRGNLTGDTRNRSQFAPLATVLLNGTGTAAAPQVLETMSRDLGSDLAGFQSNFVYYTLRLGSNTYVRLVDNADNSPGAGAEALYVDNLVVASGTTLDLNGLQVYARILQNSGTITGGTINVVANGGALSLDTPTPGHVAAIGELNDWTFTGRKGDSVTITVATGTAASPAPLAPFLNFAEVRLLDPNRDVLAQASNAAAGAVVTLPGVELPADGTYHLEVQAPAAQSASTGNYVLTAWNATVRTAPLTLNQMVTGQIDTPYRIEKWTFAAVTGQLIRFNFINASTPAIQFDLTGPDGFTGFSGLAGSSDILSLPASGSYALTAHSVQNQTGAYAFSLDQAVPTDLALGTPFSGTLAGGGQTQLFRLVVPAATQLRIDLQDSAGADHNELYAKFGAAPTRGDFQYRSTTPASANQQVNVPTAVPGTWYVLLFSKSVPKPGPFTLVARAAEVFLTAVTPDHAGNSADATLTVDGLGFDGNTAVSLLAANGTPFAASAIQIDSLTQLTATWRAGNVPPGTYSVKAAKADGASATLPSAFTVVQGGVSELKTNVIAPGGVGYHQVAQIEVEYSNPGAVAMPAPLLVLIPTQNGRAGAFLTLDQSKVTAGFWTSALPDGFSHSIQLLGSGATPGVLQPGETVRVPVYYAGWQQPWDFAYPPINFALNVLTVNNTTPVDWASMKDSLRPANFAPDAWNAIFANFVAQAGPTYGDFVKMLDATAAYLSSLGQKVSDVGELWAFALEQANNPSPFGRIQNVVDVKVAAPGLPLEFSRNYDQLISSRYTVGPLGRGWGWGDGWEVTLTVLADGTAVFSDPAGNQRRFQPDSRGGYFSSPGDRGQLVALGNGIFSVLEENGTSTRFRKDGRVDYRQDANGNRITAGYTNELLTSLTHSSGQSLQLAYNAAGRIVRVSDSASQVTTYSYDTNNEHLLSVTTAGGRTTRYTYSRGDGVAREHALLSVTYPDGTHDFLSYDNQGRLEDTHGDDNANQTKYSYGSAGLIMATDAAGAVTKFSLGAGGLLAKVEDPLGRVVQAFYDGQNHPIQLIDPAGQAYTNAFDAQGRLIRATDPLGHTTSFTYSGTFDHLSSITGPNGNTLRFDYDSRGNPDAVVFADGSTDKLAYDSLGNPITATNARGHPIQFAYDASGRVLSETFADGSQVSYSYDARGNLASSTDAHGITNFAYDASDRVTQVTQPDGRFLKYLYDAGGRRTAMTDQSGFTVNYAYDAAGRLAGLTDAAGASIVRYSYDSSGRLARQEMGNGTSTSYTYDAAGQLLSLVNRGADNSVQSRFDYTYNSLGQRTSMITLEGAWTYSYDGTGHLTQAVLASTDPEVPNHDLRYTYDAAGNLTSSTVDGVVTQYQINNRNWYTAVGTITNTYDADGNLIAQSGSNGPASYVYDDQNRLTAATSPNGTASFEYDAFGNRVALTQNGQTTRYLVDAEWLRGVVSEYDGSGTLTAHNTYGIGLANRVALGTIGLSARAAAGDATSYYAFDAAGNTVGVTGPTGALLNQYSYTPYGGLLNKAETVPNLFQFLGQLGGQNNGVNFGLGDPFTNPYSGPCCPGNPFTFYGNAAASGLDLGGWILNSVDDFIRGSFHDVGNGTWTNITTTTIDLLNAWRSDGIKVLGNGLTDPSLSVRGLGAAGLNAVFDYLGNQITKNKPYEQLDTIDKFAVNSLALLGQAASVTNTAYTFLGVSAAAAAGTPVAIVSLPAALAVAGTAATAWGLGGYINDYVIHGTIGRTTGLESLVNFIFDVPFLAWGSVNGYGSSAVVGPHDPNDKAGPAGFGTGHFIAPNQTLPYRIDFANDPAASAPAQRVVVTDQLDPSLDWNSFELTEVGFGDHTLTIAPGAQHFQTTLTMTQNGQSFDVTLELGLRSETGQVFAVIQSIDPKTSLPPDVLTGFLPPEDGTGRGLGHFSYVIRPKAGLPHGTVIANEASIVFDVNEPILTPATRNTIDASPPQIATHTINGGLPERSRLTRIDFKFVEDTAVAFGADALQLYNQTTGQLVPAYNATFSYDPLTQTGTVQFAASASLADGNYTATLKGARVTDLGGLPLAQDYSASFFVLAGDANGDRTTNDLDLYRVWQNQLKAPAARDPNDDLNGDGQVNIDDVNVVKQHYLARLPAPGPANAIPRPGDAMETAKSQDADLNPRHVGALSPEQGGWPPKVAAPSVWDSTTARSWPALQSGADQPEEAYSSRYRLSLGQVRIKPWAVN